MNRNDFMRELEELLSDISEEEKSEALLYYENYFEDAGPESEQTIISELGSPRKVAAGIKAELNASSHESRGYFTENGFEDGTFEEPKYEILNGKHKAEDSKQSTNGFKQNTESGNRFAEENDKTSNDYAGNRNYTGNRNQQRNVNTNNTVKVILIIIVCIFAIPVGIPVIATIFSIIIAVVSVIFAIWIAFTAVAIALTIAGIIVTIVGIVKLVTLPMMGVSLTGIGLVLFGVGALFAIATAWITVKAIPTIFHFIVDVCKLPFKNRRVTA